MKDDTSKMPRAAFLRSGTLRKSPELRGQISTATMEMIIAFPPEKGTLIQGENGTNVIDLIERTDGITSPVEDRTLRQKLFLMEKWE